MTPGNSDAQKGLGQQLQRIYQQLDKFEERIDKLEGKVTVATKWLERIEHRLERMEEVRAELVQALTKLQYHAAIEQRKDGQGKSGTDHPRRKRKKAGALFANMGGLGARDRLRPHLFFFTLFPVGAAVAV